MRLSLLSSCLLLLACCLAMLQPTDVNAQSNKSENRPVRAWVNLGIGSSGGDGLTAYSFIAHAQYNSRFGLLGLRYMRADDSAIRGFWDYKDEIIELSLTYGFTYNHGILNLSGSTGVGVLQGTQYGPSFMGGEIFRVATFPVHGSIMIQPLRFVGLGLMLSSSINSHTTIHSTSLVLQLGLVR